MKAISFRLQDAGFKFDEASQMWELELNITQRLVADIAQQPITPNIRKFVAALERAGNAIEILNTLTKKNDQA